MFTILALTKYIYWSAQRQMGHVNSSGCCNQSYKYFFKVEICSDGAYIETPWVREAITNHCEGDTNVVEKIKVRRPQKSLHSSSGRNYIGNISSISSVYSCSVQLFISSHNIPNTHTISFFYLKGLNHSQYFLIYSFCNAENECCTASG